MGVVLERIASFFDEAGEARKILEKAYTVSITGQPCIRTNAQINDGLVPIGKFFARHHTAYLNRLAYKTPHSVEILRREIEPAAPTVPLFGGVPDPMDDLSGIESRRDRDGVAQGYFGKWED